MTDDRVGIYELHTVTRMGNTRVSIARPGEQIARSIVTVKYARPISVSRNEVALFNNIMCNFFHCRFEKIHVENEVWIVEEQINYGKIVERLIYGKTNCGRQHFYFFFISTSLKQKTWLRWTQIPYILSAIKHLVESHHK